MIIHSGRLPDSMKASMTLRRLASFFGFNSSLLQQFPAQLFSSRSRSIDIRISRIASAPIMAVKASSPYSS
jgi:hypothetical protein